MSRRKNVDNTSVKHGSNMRFLTEASSKSASKMVSVRVPQDLLDQFNEASRRAEEAGYELSMTRVVQEALRMAVEEAQSIPAKQEALPLNAA